MKSLALFVFRDLRTLHTFSDASRDAYAAVSYLVSNYYDHKAASRLVASKTRVTPLKSVTIPRLELMGAVLATRLATSILQTFKVNGATYWTDSTNVSTRPEFLTDTTKPWPERLTRTTAIGTQAKEEVKVQSHATADLTDERDRMDPSRYSSWNHLLRVTAWVRRF